MAHDMHLPAGLIQILPMPGDPLFFYLTKFILCLFFWVLFGALS